MKKISWVVAMLFVCSSLWASDIDSIKTKIGIYGGYNYNIHSANFGKLRDVPHCCKLYESGSGSGFNFGALFDYKLGRNFWLGARLGIMKLDGTLISKEEGVGMIVEGEYVNGAFEHQMEGGFTNLSLEPTITYTPDNKFYISLGLRAGTLMSATYDQREQIVKPSRLGTFVDENGVSTGKRTRNEFSGDIGEVDEVSNFQMHGMAMVSYELPVNKKKNLFLVPELAYYLPMTEHVKDKEWKVNAIRGGLALKYAFLPKKDKPILYEDDIEIDTIEVESDVMTEAKFVEGETMKLKTARIETDESITIIQDYKRVDTLYRPKVYLLDADIHAVGYNKGKEIDNPTFLIEEFVSNRLDPVLNYVFFENNSAEIPARYDLLSADESKNFQINNLFYKSTLEIYRNILNILGQRMKKLPKTTLTITGCNSNFGQEKGNLTLSENRALAVKEYLVNTWGISEKRLIIKKRNLPKKPSFPFDEELKIPENRRVELTSSSSELLKPIFIEKVDRTSNPPAAKFYLSAHAEKGVKKWRIEAKHKGDDKLLFVKEGAGEAPESVIWNLEEVQETMPSKEIPLEYTFIITDNNGKVRQAGLKEIDVKVTTVREKRINKIGDYEVEKFSLILFDFDKSNISGSNSKIIDMISERISPTSKVEIVGYTDNTGEQEHNQKLSEKRAKSADKALKFKNTVTKGIGKSEYLFDNITPEARFYNRTVVITVTTEVK